ncbi:MAG: electron transfer flavoprotein subunit beta/FixA family protein [Desulfobacterales bacterium]|nr:electron transfer flavoprotein subunit beta/FixA family protein [Desulfobacterales bacterium]
MKILICVKQVPEITDVTINPETGTLVREGVASILNPFCEYAIEVGLDLRRYYGDIEIVTISMGPPQAKAALMRCLETGADRAILLSDRGFAGSDTWATALTLAEAIRAMENDFDLILVGKQAIDGDTAQVGPELAEILGIPQVMYGVGIELAHNKKKIRVRREIEKGYEIVEMKLPGLISISKGPMIRSVSSFKEILEARKKELRVVTASDLTMDEDELGLKGSPTQVVKIFPPGVKKGGELIDGSEAQGAAEKLVEFLKERNFI